VRVGETPRAEGALRAGAIATSEFGMAAVRRKRGSLKSTITRISRFFANHVEFSHD
jgi:hypothetical protein